MVVGTRLKATREQSIMSQEDLAHKAGVTVATISRIENGHRFPRPSTVRKLAETLGVSPTWLMYGEEASGQPKEE